MAEVRVKNLGLSEFTVFSLYHAVSNLAITLLAEFRNNRNHRLLIIYNVDHPTPPSTTKVVTLSCIQTFAALRPNVPLSTGNLTLCSQDGNVATVTSASRLASISRYMHLQSETFSTLLTKVPATLWHMIGPPYLSANK